MLADCTSRENVNGEMQARPFIGGNFFPVMNVTMASGSQPVRRLCIIIFGFGLRPDGHTYLSQKQIMTSLTQITMG
jgi:hypothetical protein